MHSYVFVFRFAKRFNKDASWIYNCTCNRSQAELTDSLPSQMTISYDDFKQQLIDCLHVKAAQAVLGDVDAIYDIHPDMDFQGLNELI